LFLIYIYYIDVIEVFGVERSVEILEYHNCTWVIFKLYPLPVFLFIMLAL
jgi:hypothetical protein